MKKEAWCLGITLLLILCVTNSALAADTGEVKSTNTSYQDKLSDILSKGRLVLAITNSSGIIIHNDTERDPQSHCTDNQYSKNQLSGERRDFASKIAEELGVDACFVTTDMNEIRKGNWGDKWDYFLEYYLTKERMKWLYFSQPVKASPSVFFIRSDNTNISDLKDLSGKKIGVSGNSTQGNYLRNTLDMYGDITENPIKNPKIIEYASVAEAIDDLVAGTIDAILFPQISMKSEEFNATPVTQLEPYAFIGYSGPAVERSNSTNSTLFVQKLNEIIQKLHKNGYLSDLSLKYFGYDITKKAEEFDISSLNQFNESS
jgi:ABC-type amino acid transport substrate-binding protein